MFVQCTLYNVHVCLQQSETDVCVNSMYEGCRDVCRHECVCVRMRVCVCVRACVCVCVCTKVCVTIYRYGEITACVCVYICNVL